MPDVNLNDLIPIIYSILPALVVEPCEATDGKGNKYPGLSISPPDDIHIPDGCVSMTTVAVMGDKIVIGIHSPNRESVNLDKDLSDDYQNEILALVHAMWSLDEPS